MKRLGNLFERLVSIENLNLALDRAARHKRFRTGVVRTLELRDRRIPALKKMLEEGRYRTSVYDPKIIYEPKLRTIYSLPFFPDRIVHHAIMNILEPHWDRQLIFDCYANRRGKGMHKGSQRAMEFVRKYKYVLQCDISKFYPTLDHEILKKMLRHKIKDEKFLALLDEIIDSSNRIPGAVPGKNVPIGNLLSQWFGNMYMGIFDTWIKQEMRVGAYIRYCDDFVIFSDEKKYLNDLRGKIVFFLQNRLALRLSKATLFPVSRGLDFLGYRHFPKYILVRKRVAKKIKRFARKFHDGAYDGRIERAKGVAASYNGILSHADTKNLRASMHFEEILEKLGVKA